MTNSERDQDEHRKLQQFGLSKADRVRRTPPTLVARVRGGVYLLGQSTACRERDQILASVLTVSPTSGKNDSIVNWLSSPGKESIYLENRRVSMIGYGYIRLVILIFHRSAVITSSTQSHSIHESVHYVVSSTRNNANDNASDNTVLGGFL